MIPDQHQHAQIVADDRARYIQLVIQLTNHIAGIAENAPHMPIMSREERIAKLTSLRRELDDLGMAIKSANRRLITDAELENIAFSITSMMVEIFTSIVEA